MAVVTQDNVYPTKILQAYDSNYSDSLCLLPLFKRNHTIEVKLFAGVQP